MSSPFSSYSGASVSTWITGGISPSLSVRKLGSTPSTPSCSDQYVHISRSRYSSPSGPLTVIFPGRSSIPQTSLTQGPTATTRCSQSTSPSSVCTDLTAPSCILNPVILTPV